MTIFTFETKESIQFQERLAIKFGGDTYTVTKWLEPSQFGNTVMIRQKSSLLLENTYKLTECIRPVLSIYRKYCELDLMEVNHLNIMADKGVRPQRIDIKAMWAQYEDQNLLSALRGNLMLMSAIRD